MSLEDAVRHLGGWRHRPSGSDPGAMGTKSRRRRHSTETRRDAWRCAHLFTHRAGVRAGRAVSRSTKDRESVRFAIWQRFGVVRAFASVVRRRGTARGWMATSRRHGSRRRRRRLTGGKAEERKWRCARLVTHGAGTSPSTEARGSVRWVTRQRLGASREGAGRTRAFATRWCPRGKCAGSPGRWYP
jgi:hypothetical protein